MGGWVADRMTSRPLRDQGSVVGVQLIGTEAVVVRVPSPGSKVTVNVSVPVAFGGAVVDLGELQFRHLGVELGPADGVGGEREGSERLERGPDRCREQPVVDGHRVARRGGVRIEVAGEHGVGEERGDHRDRVPVDAGGIRATRSGCGGSRCSNVGASRVALFGGAAEEPGEAVRRDGNDVGTELFERRRRVGGVGAPRDQADGDERGARRAAALRIGGWLRRSRRVWWPWRCARPGRHRRTRRPVTGAGAGCSRHRGSTGRRRRRSAPGRHRWVTRSAGG